MNDFDYDCLQKKRLARNAYARKGTKNRKGYRLPHENLTKKEREALNGEVKTVGFNDKISWEFFKALPKDLQEEYIQKQIDRFGVSTHTISTNLFGLSRYGLDSHIERYGLNVRGPGKGARMTKGMRDSWERWLGWQKDEEPSSAPIEESTDVPQVTMCEEDFVEPVENAPPFRAHDYEDMLRECDLGRKDDGANKASEFIKTVPYPTLQDMGINLEGTPVEVMTTLANAIPALLDQNKTYRFSIKIDTFFLNRGDRVL